MQGKRQFSNNNLSLVEEHLSPIKFKRTECYDTCNDELQNDFHNRQDQCLDKSPICVLKESLLSELPSPWKLADITDEIQIYELYTQSASSLSVKQTVVIDQDFKAKIFVHRREVAKEHSVWDDMPERYCAASDILKLLHKIQRYSVCYGNPNEEYQDLIPVGAGLSDGFTSEIRAYREGDFCAVKGNRVYHSCIRSSKCDLLVDGSRCKDCSKVRNILYHRQRRLEEKNFLPPVNYLSSHHKHRDMKKDELITKINQQKTEIKSLTNEVERHRRNCDREIIKNGVCVDVVQNEELKDLMATCRVEVEKSYPDSNSFQRLFWEQQLKFEKSGKNGMRWHPMIIRWCLYIRNKSVKAYDAMRDAGFIKLPSARTLFDYSHYTKSALGFQPDVIKMLKGEAEKLDLYSEDYKCYVGLLFDEIRVKEDLVYDKHTGELIGYCNLDCVGNQILELERLANPDKKSELAKYMLVLMVRGVASSLKFPMAGFSTNSITADFLYPIIWKAVSLLENVVKLKVLYITCDGASANRKFFQLHKVNVNDNFVHYTVNPHDTDRNIYFISDVPHLLKTTRNCFSNSYSRSMSRRLWKDGKDISWMHIVSLFEDYCELNLYTPCPKLTRSHIDLTSFSCMKVNLAAQVMSASVANALEELYDDRMSETVQFIRHFNKFFDCLNVRSLYEGRNKRNPDLMPYVTVDDDRLEWLKLDFLNYLNDWKVSAMNRAGNFTTSQISFMQLSHQTITGLKISINSITDCVKYILEKGAPFVLTHNFNQDPLEQHFGLYRHKGGANNNPSVYEVRNMMTQLRAVGAQALVPRHGNIRRQNEGNQLQVIDNTPLPKRKK